MERLVEFSKKNKDIIKALISFVLFAIFSVFAVIELGHINFKTYHELFNSLAMSQRFLVLALGMITFLCCTIYDFVLCKYFDLKLDKKSILKISFITQSFNNFISFGGLTGTKLRSSLYEKIGVDPKISLKMATSVLSSGLLGLFTLITPFVLIFGKTDYPYIYFLCLLSLYIPFYFFADRLKTGRFQEFIDENSPFSFLDNKIKFKLLLASCFDWITVSLYFAFIAKMIVPGASLKTSIIVYVISEMVGIISFIPGGIGSFDLCVIVLFSSIGLDRDSALLALMLFRISFYVIPWIIGVTLFLKQQIESTAKRYQQSQQIIASIVSTLILVSGIVLIISTATPAMMERIKILKTFVPKQVMALSKEITFFIGVLLIILSRGIKLKITRIYQTSIVVLILGAIGCLLKGLDYEEAIILLVFASLLYYTRGLYTNEHSNFSKRDFYSLGMMIIFFSFAFVIIYDISHKINIYTSESAFSLKWIENNPAKILLYFLLCSVIMLLCLYSRKDFKQFEEVTDKDIDEFKEFLKDKKGTYFTHLYLVRDKNIFYNSKKTVGMLYRPYKNNIIVLGDPFGIKEDFEDAIDELIEYAAGLDMNVSFYEVLGSNLELYANQGFSFIKIGEDATVMLDQFTYEGKKNKGLRHEKNRLEVENLSFEITNPPHSKELMKKLKYVSDNWLAGKNELSFSLGSFDETYLQESPIAMLKDKDQNILTFANLQYVVNTKKLSIDLMRYDRDLCQKGEMNLLFLCLIDYAKENGYEEFYLGMAPLSNVGGKKYSGTKEKILKMVYEYADKIYSFQGLRFFKEKFHPVWNGRYIIYKNDMHLPEVMLSILNLVHRKK